MHRHASGTIEGVIDRSGAVGATLSVILPNYNHAALLPRALAALLAQDRPPDEIIIVEDGSTDDSLAVIAAWQARDSRIRCLVNPCNLGVIAALQRGLAAAVGRYVYFGAADDWVLKGFFARALKVLEAHPQCGFYCGDAALVEGATGASCGFRPIARPRFGRGVVTAQRALRLLGKIDNWVLTGSTVFRRDAVLAAGGFDARLGSLADGFLSRKIALSQGCFYDPEPVAVWSLFADSASRRTVLHDAAAVLRDVPPLIAADPAFPPWYAALFRRRWHFAVARLAITAHRDDDSVLALGAESGLDRLVVSAVALLAQSRLGQVVALGLLWLRWRPTTLWRVASTALERRMSLRNPSKMLELQKADAS